MNFLLSDLNFFFRACIGHAKAFLGENSDEKWRSKFEYNINNKSNDNMSDNSPPHFIGWYLVRM